MRTSESSLRTLIYLVTFSLLAVTDLDTWLASSRTRAFIWSLLDLGAASTLILLSYLCMVLPSAWLTWERDLYWNWRVRVLSYTYPVVSPAAFIIRTTFIFGDVLVLAISYHLVT